jgi:hypothetical protein
MSQWRESRVAMLAVNKWSGETFEAGDMFRADSGGQHGTWQVWLTAMQMRRGFIISFLPRREAPQQPAPCSALLDRLNTETLSGCLSFECEDGFVLLRGGCSLMSWRV